jgi:hypothetical protein
MAIGSSKLPEAHEKYFERTTAAMAGSADISCQSSAESSKLNTNVIAYIA